MRRAELEVTQEEAWSIFDHSQYNVLSCIGVDNIPYAIGISCARIGTTLYFHCANEGAKLEAIQQNPNVCITSIMNVENAVEKFTTYYSSSVIRGVAHIVHDEQSKLEALRCICQKFTPSLMATFEEASSKSMKATTICAIEVSSITGKSKQPHE